MERDKEERILTIKLNTSQNPSTSVVSDTSPLVSSDSSKKKDGTKAMDQIATNRKIEGCRYKQHSRQADSSQVDKEVEHTERVHWEPPCGQNLQQE